MPSRLQLQIDLADAEERKKRQEKFRKRTRSFFNKARLLAKDTDAWVALIVRDRYGRVQSFRSSDSLYWPPSIQDLIKIHPSSTHEFLKKHAISGCWKEVAEDESDSALVGGDTDSFTEDVLARRMTPVEMEVRSDNDGTVNQCHVGKEVAFGANAPKDKTIGIVEPQKSAINALRESKNTLVVGLRESDGTTVDVPRESDYTNVDAPEESDNPSVDPHRRMSSVTLGSDREPDGTVVELRESDNITFDTVRESNDTILGEHVESENATFLLLGDSDNATGVLGESMMMNGLDTTEVGPTTFEYDRMDLDKPEAKSKAEIKAREDGSIEAANELCMMSHSPRAYGGLGSWQLINWPRMTRQDGRQGWGSKLSTGIDPKELLEGWDWVFQRK